MPFVYVGVWEEHSAIIAAVAPSLTAVPVRIQERTSIAIHPNPGFKFDAKPAVPHICSPARANVVRGRVLRSGIDSHNSITI